MIPPFTRALVAEAFIFAATVGLSGATQADDNIRVAFNFGPPVGPRMLHFCNPVLNVMLITDAVKDVPERMSIVTPVCKLDAVIG